MKIIGLGDSITAGVSLPVEVTFLHKLGLKYGNSTRNAGIGGATSTNGLGRLKSDVLDHSADVCIVEFGMNDHVLVAKDEPKTSLAVFKENLTAICENIKLANISPVLCTVHPIIEGDAEHYYYKRHPQEWYCHPNGAQAWIDLYNEGIREVGREIQVPVADVALSFQDYIRNGGALTDLIRTVENSGADDGVHPTAEGHDIYAACIGVVLETLKSDVGKKTKIYESFDDRGIKPSKMAARENLYSPYCDLFYYESTVSPGEVMAAQIIKPAKPSYILVGTHGWHGTLSRYKPMEEPDPNNNYLRIEVDMRGRKFSDGKADCNGWELYDVIDAVNYARKHYAEYIIDPDVVYFQSGSGGGGNAFAIIGKFPDFFAAATAFCGISDYKLWYDNDQVGEFRDEMDVWIGMTPEENEMAYRSRSGLHLLENLQTPFLFAHGETDIRVPSEHSRNYEARARELGKSHLIRYIELPGVGTNAHWGNATQEQLAAIFEQSDINRQQNRKPVELPRQGKLVVGGYVYTKHFSVVLDSIDKVAVVDYDLDANTFTVTCDTECQYTIRRY